MTVWCDSCRSCHVSSRCAPLHQREEDPRRAAYRRYRSTKGASKARRDHINHEIRNMRALLPIGPEDQERLSYLHSMAAICTYIRKSVLFQGLQTADRSDSCLPYEAFLEALHGFILVCTAQGRLVYVSENVAEYLGLSMVDVLQGDTLYDLVDRSDLDVVRTNLDVKNNSSAERSFVCCMQTSKSFKLRHGSCCSMLVRGSFQFFPQSFSAASRSTEPVFVALCTPTVNRLASGSSRVCQSFSSEHRADMSFTQTSESVFFLLGYSAEEMSGRSWYSLVHPEDLALAADSHRSLVQADEGFQVEVVLRLQTTDLSWTWVYIQAKNTREQLSISCTNFIISETEARFLQRKTSSEAFRPPSGSNYPHFAQQASQSWTDNPKGCKRLRRCNSRSEDPGAVLCSSSQSDGSPAPFDLFTPPYSPASSGSPPQQEEPLSSPGSSPSYYSYPAAVLTCHQSPADSASRTAEPTFDPPPPSMSPPLSLPLDYGFVPRPSNARSVPDCLFVSDVSELPAESSSLHLEDFDLLDPPRWGGPVQLQHVPHQQEPPGLLTPLQSPGSTSLYSEREQEEISILAQQISSLANSFDRHRSLDLFQQVVHTGAGDWHHEPLGGHASMFETILSPGKTALSCLGLHPYQGQETLDLFQEDPLPEEQFCPGGITVDPFSLQLGHQNLNTGLHQLTFCLSRLQPDGLTEQTLY